MLIGEPAPTQADLHFRLFGIPVRVHPFFWIATLILGMGGRAADPVNTLIWVAVVFVSILVHEFGHATLQRAFGGHPWITLYSFGGLASCNDCGRSPGRQIAILLAGPGAGFFLAAALVLGVKVAGHEFGFVTLRQLTGVLESGVLQPVPLIGGLYGYFELFREPLVNRTIVYGLHVNIVWGLINLLPVYPLDGGQIARELFTLGNPRSGIIQSLQLSAGVAVLLAAYAILNQNFYVCLMFGYLAYASFQTLQMYRSHGR
jgi:Zn-dependent protease